MSNNDIDVKTISMCNANKELMSLTLIVDALRVIDIVSLVENIIIGHIIMMTVN